MAGKSDTTLNAIYICKRLCVSLCRLSIFIITLAVSSADLLLQRRTDYPSSPRLCFIQLMCIDTDIKAEVLVIIIIISCWSLA